MQSNLYKSKCGRCGLMVEAGKGFAEPSTSRTNYRGNYVRAPWIVYCAACAAARAREQRTEKAGSLVRVAQAPGYSVAFSLDSEEKVRVERSKNPPSFADWSQAALQNQKESVKLGDMQAVAVECLELSFDEAALEIGRIVLKTLRQRAQDMAKGE